VTNEVEEANGAAPQATNPTNVSEIIGVGPSTGTVLQMSKWEQRIWIWVARGLGFVGLMLIIFVAGTLLWITREMTTLGGKDLAFSFAGIGLLSLTLLRFLAILIGAGMVFGGLVVSFFAHTKASTIGASGTANGSPASFSLATASPGLAAIVVGAVVIVSALYAKGNYKYEAPSQVIVVDQGSTKPVTPMKPPSEIGKEKDQEK
jgi:hypothetical protein